MAEHIIEMRPEGANDYGDIVYPKTKANAVIDLDRFGSASGTNAYAVTIGSVPQLYVGLRVTVMFTNANTGASTLNVNGLGAKPIIKANGSGLSSGNIKAGSIQSLVYNGTSFQLVGEGGEYGTALASDVLQGKTIGTESGLVSGTIPNYTAVNGTATKAEAVYMYKVPVWNDVNMLVTVPPGYYSGAHSIGFKVPNLIPEHIRYGAQISSNPPSNSGLVGTFTGLGNAVAPYVLAPYTFSTSTLSNATGTMVNRGAVTSSLTTQGGAYTIPAGYHSGAGKVTASFSNLVASNVKSGVNIGGVVGTYKPLVNLSANMGSTTAYASPGQTITYNVTGVPTNIVGIGVTCRKYDSDRDRRTEVNRLSGFINTLPWSGSIQVEYYWVSDLNTLNLISVVQSGTTLICQLKASPNNVSNIRTALNLDVFYI